MIIKLYIVITLVLYFVFNNKNKMLGLLLFLSVVNIIVTDLFKHFRIDTFFNNNIYVLAHNLLWILLLQKQSLNPKLSTSIIWGFLFFNCFSLFYSSIFKEFNFNAFILGALIYTTLFVFESYSNLKKENLSFFISNNYILLFAPILFFLGMSFMLGFRSKSVTGTVLFGEVKLYTFVNYFVNIIYYSLINIYIYKERKKYAK
jgi:hypothetical protein